jgi:phage terminase large subunit
MEKIPFETRIKLDRFKLRPYQEPIWDALENKGYKRLLVILPRRSGKDICCLNLLLRQALKKVGIYYYLLPTYSQARKTIWDSLTNTGVRFMDYIPKELVSNINSTEMKVRLVNDSLIQFLGSDNFDSLVGTNPSGCIFSEYALQDPRAYQFLRPALTATGGFAIFISTPRGKNHLWEMWNIATRNPNDWFSYRLTVEDTRHIPLHEIQKELASGEMSEDLVQQEYYCSFDQGVEGSYYGKYLDRMRVKGQISIVPYETGFKVHSAWDLGVRDSTSIILFQTVGQIIRIIDFYENSKVGLEHYIEILEQKRKENGWIYGKHIAPHDIRQREFTSGVSRIEMAKRMGITFTISNEIEVADGIEAVRAAFSKIWIDEKNCSVLIKHLENYRQEYDAKKKVYKPYPLHDNHSHAADAMRYLCCSLPKTRDDLSPEELEKRYQEAVYGNQSGLPDMFKDDYKIY